ncbi:MAG: methyl-accepting chemotaxis protein [Spirochaetales bacterium]|nr:methyl-accepting chemotaxis protein [Spirochaetales bacterium]
MSSQDVWIERVQEIDAFLGRVCLRFGETLPCLLEELKAVQSEVLSHQGQSTIHDEIQRIRTLIQSLEKKNMGMPLIEESPSHSEIVLLAHLDQNLKAIYDRAGEIELVSINANITAKQSGTQGLGFSVVSREIKSLSARTNAFSIELLSLNAQVKSDLTHFIHEVQNLSHRYQQQMNQLTQEILDAANHGESYTHDINKTLHEDLQEIKNAEAPIFVMMEKLQFQDFFCQSVGHLYSVLKCEGEPLNWQKPAIRKTLLTIASGILSELREELHQCIQELESQLMLICELLDLHRPTFHFHQIQSNQMNDMGTHLEKDIQNLHAYSESLIHRTSKITQTLQNFARNESSWFSIITAAKIEVSKNHRLQGMEDAVESMRLGVDEILESVHRGMDTSDTIMTLVNQEVRRFEDDSQRLSQQLYFVFEKWEECQNQLVKIRHEIDAIQQLQHNVVQRFAPALNSISLDLKSFKEMESSMTSIIVSIQEDIDSLGNEVLTLEEENEIGKIIEKFSIRNQKNYAGLMEMNAEEDLTDGETLLF